ncbi:MAG: SDR family NAD(P)-dependent oxidoreductase [Gammaproteobacteria bacterium]|nr:SDR family NAD(P)-dependent oxidoreductase [Gammaproteobacteria bacterium]
MKYLVVTGASSGIGLATAERFLQAKFEVINLSRRPCPINQVHSYPADLSSHELQSVIELVITEHFNADNDKEIHLVHNAAQFSLDNALDTSDESLHAILQVNVIAANTLNRLIIPKMGKNSSVIFVGSTLSEKAISNTFSYVTSKHAQLGMMKSLCQDLTNPDVHVAAICPGFTDTAMLRANAPEEILVQLGARTAFGRLISPEEIAEAIFWVSQNPVVNGSVIHANLGQKEW